MAAMTLIPSPARQMRLPLRAEAVAERLVVSGCNENAVRTLSTWPTGVERVLALAGPTGCGKSLIGRVWAERLGAYALDGAEAALIDPLELEGRPILLDEAQDADDETLFHLINLAQSGGGALLLVSRNAPREWKVDLRDLRSRLDGLRLITVGPPDDQVLAAILRARFAERSIAPAGEVIEYLLRRIDRSPAAAVAVVDQLDAEHRPVTRALARQVLDRTPAA